MRKLHPKLVIPIISLVAIVAGLLYGVSLLQGTTEWLITLTPTDVYMYQPMTLKVYSYNSPQQVIYPVTCNLTLLNSTDVIWFRTVSGQPIIYNFTIEKNGTYTLELYCVNSLNETYQTTFDITVKYPTPSIVYNAYWQRPVDINVTTPYPYDNVPVKLYYKGNEYSGTLVNGVASFKNLPSITEKEKVYVEIFGYTTAYEIVPKTPSLYITVNPTKIPKDSYAYVTSWLSDNYGNITLHWPIKYTVDGACRIEGQDFYTNTQYKIVPETKCPTCPEQCTIAVEAELWPGMTISNTTTLTILPINITDSGIKYTNSTPWNYNIEAYVTLDTAVEGNLTLYIDNNPVTHVAGYGKSFTASYSIEFMPGTHIVSARFHFMNTTIELEHIIINVPKHPYTIEPPPAKVYAGDPIILSNAYWYTYIPKNDTVFLIAYYPGDAYYKSTSKIFKVKLIYPEINLTETMLSVRNAAPGANIKVYCVIGSHEELVLEINVKHENFTMPVPTILDCDSVKLVYEHGSYKLIKYANEPERIDVLTTTCTAGTPCILLRPTPEIRFVKIGDTPYTPGKPIILKEGFYTMYIYTRDGYVITVPVHVVSPNIKVVTYKSPTGTGWIVEVYGPPDIQVKIVLRDGRTITLGVGTHIVYEEPMSAYWPYSEIEFIKATLLTSTQEG